MTVNIPALRGHMVEKGVDVDFLSEKLGINKSTFYRKLNAKGRTFTVGEVHNIAEALRLTKDETANIFLFSNSQ